MAENESKWLNFHNWHIIFLLNKTSQPILVFKELNIVLAVIMRCETDLNVILDNIIEFPKLHFFPKRISFSTKTLRC